jgi:3-oxoacyl-[acyl-carrier-protein] synthase II
MAARDVVITGIGVVSPIGIGREAFWASLLAGRSGVGPIASFDASGLPVRIAAEVRDFDPKQYVKPRKSLKVMSRDAQFAVTAADLAWDDAGLNAATPDPERVGVVIGAERIRNEFGDIEQAYRACRVDGRFEPRLWATTGAAEGYPLMLLKNLPNMLGSFVSILKDARGPNNTLCQAEVSSLLAIGEAAACLERGAADVMIAGGAASRMHPIDWVRSEMAEELSHEIAHPAAASRPFDARRSGQVRGEGGALFVLETQAHATARGAGILGRVLSWTSSAAAPAGGTASLSAAIERTIRRALEQAEVAPSQIRFVSAHGLSTRMHDAIEAQALCATIGTRPVVALKSYFGNLNAAGGAVELAATVLALNEGLLPATLNYEVPDPHCPIEVVHGEPRPRGGGPALALNFTAAGQVAAVVIAGPE